MCMNGVKSYCCHPLIQDCSPFPGPPPWSLTASFFPWQHHVHTGLDCRLRERERARGLGGGGRTDTHNKTKYIMQAQAAGPLSAQTETRPEHAQNKNRSRTHTHTHTSWMEHRVQTGRTDHAAGGGGADGIPPARQEWFSSGRGPVRPSARPHTSHTNQRGG